MNTERKYFGTDGVRGAYGGPLINETFARRLGEAAGRWAGGRGRALVGRDTRASGEPLAEALAEGLRAAGMEPVPLGVIPTPAVAWATRSEKAALGAVVTASHNPAGDNGIKFIGSDGRKLNDEQEAGIERELAAGKVAADPRQGGCRPPGGGRDAAGACGRGREFSAFPPSPGGRRPPSGQSPSGQPPSGRPPSDALEGYLRVVTGLLPAGALRGWRVVLDTSNGATCVTSPAVFRALGAEVAALGGSPDGRNINAGVGSEHPEALAARVRAEAARLGVAHDGDGDRCVLVDEQGGVLDGDEILAILAVHALSRGALTARTVVATVQSNLGLDAAVAAAGGRVVRTAVGDRYVIEGMGAAGAALGGESSGHIIFGEVSPSGDGLVAALKVIEVMRETGRPLSELRRVLKKFPQATASVPVRERRPLAELTALTAALAALEAELGERGRVLVRYSGTEPKLRLLVEGPTEEIVRAGLTRLEAAARMG